ncbi:hypothetical protein PHYPSEUDO_010270 [Phytophthora pseudosyringae]|uniref:Uncharacterized protein n=1 Tax=Phytophthora pseudosyringae TaxID=221518 RepID=A0A8T1VDK5_9STRA|nr:hypothetical protein PHYPSEUDO_010270 [Phytophthora pseudosyringae]
MSKRPFSPGMVSDMGQRDHAQVVSRQEKRPRFGVVNSLSQSTTIPDDIEELFTYLDDGGLPESDMDLLPTQCDDRLRQQKQKMKCFKVQMQAMERDLARSRRVGRTLESDMGRLRRQRQKERSYERRAKRDIQAREETVTGRERACASLQGTLVRLKSILENEKHSNEQDQVKSVVRDLVHLVELSTAASNSEATQEDLAWLKLREEDWRAYAAWIEKEWRETEELHVVEQQLLTKRVGSLATQLETTLQRLQVEERTGTELKTSCNLLEQELACKSDWLTALALGSMSLVNTQDQIATRVRAERDEWQRDIRQLQHQTDELQTQYVEQLNQFQAESRKLQEQLRVSRRNELNAQKQLQTSQKTAKNAKKKAQTELKTLRDKVKVLQHERTAVNGEAAPSQLDVLNVSPLVQANPERLLTLRSTDFAAKCLRDD